MVVTTPGAAVQGSWATVVSPPVTQAVTAAAAQQRPRARSSTAAQEAPADRTMVEAASVAGAVAETTEEAEGADTPVEGVAPATAMAAEEVAQSFEGFRPLLVGVGCFLWLVRLLEVFQLLFSSEAKVQ